MVVGVPLISVLMVLVIASTVVPTLAELQSPQDMLEEDVVEASTGLLDEEVVASTEVLFQSSQLMVLFMEAEEVVEAAIEVGVVLLEVVASTEVELPQSSHDIVELDEVVSAKTLELDAEVVLEVVASTEALELDRYPQELEEDELDEATSTDELEAVVVVELRASTDELLAVVEAQSDQVILPSWRRWKRWWEASARAKEATTTAIVLKCISSIRSREKSFDLKSRKPVLVVTRRVQQNQSAS